MFAEDEQLRNAELSVRADTKNDGDAVGLGGIGSHALTSRGARKDCARWRRCQ